MENQNSVLITHAGAHKVGLNELTAIPAPAPLGPHHKPVAHIDLIGNLKTQLAEVGYGVKREEYAVQHKGSLLFGVMDIAPATDVPMVLSNGDKGMSLGFRHGNDMTMSLQMVAGARVFVCDNLVLSGSMIVMKRKHTTNLSITDEVHAAVGRLLDQYKVLDQGIGRLKAMSLSTIEAEAKIYEAFAVDKVMPMRFMEDVGEWYFKAPEKNAPDCEPRNLWALHNAFTRTIKEVESPARQFEITNHLGEIFHLTGVGA